MPNKFCPFSFFSFYVNKDSAQAGGAHHCVEANCALWDSRFEQCSLKTACENIGGATSAPSRKPRAVSDILAKIRSKKKSAEVTTPGAKPAATPTPGPVTPPEKATSTEGAPIAVPAAPNVEASKTETPKLKANVDELLVAPAILAAQLPIVTPSEVDNGLTENTQ